MTNKNATRMVAKQTVRSPAGSHDDDARQARQRTLMLIGAHPDDAEYHAGGLAALCAQAGWKIVMLHATDGAAGHFRGPPAALRRRRVLEARAAAAVVGATSMTLGQPDGGLYVTAATTRAMATAIRRAQPDVLVTHRCGDYHRDHDRTAQLVRDCAYLLQAPLFCPRVKPLAHLPVILYYADRFTEPGPFVPHWGVNLEPAIAAKAAMLAAHRSQFAEWLPYIGAGSSVLPYARYATAYATLEDGMQELVRELGRRSAKAFGRAFQRRIRYLETFQISEYGDGQAGRRLSDWLPALVPGREGWKKDGGV